MVQFVDFSTLYRLLFQGYSLLVVIYFFKDSFIFFRGLLACLCDKKKKIEIFISKNLETSGSIWITLIIFLHNFGHLLLLSAGNLHNLHFFPLFLIYFTKKSEEKAGREELLKFFGPIFDAFSTQFWPIFQAKILPRLQPRKLVAPKPSFYHPGYPL